MAETTATRTDTRPEPRSLRESATGSGDSPDEREILDSLQVDLEKEHAAVVMYLLHGWRMGKNGPAEDVRRIAREEMWHMEWLGEAIAERGGVPSVRREDVFTFDSIRASLERDIQAEQEAVSHYKHTLSLLGDGDEQLRRLIERIVDDEHHHEAQFRELLRGVDRLGERALRPTEVLSRVDAAAVDPNLRREYEGLLQYLWNKFACGEGEEAESYFELSVDEMRHMQWLAERMAGTRMPSVDMPEGGSVSAMRSCDGARERAQAYEDVAMGEYMHARDGVVDEDLRTLLNRIIFQHDYHQFRLQSLAEE